MPRLCQVGRSGLALPNVALVADIIPGPSPSRWPASAAHIWTIDELIEVATTPEPEGRPVGWFRVIEGGRDSV